MSNLTDFESHKRDEEFSRREDSRAARRAQDIAGFARWSEVASVADALDKAMRLLCPVVQNEHLHEKALNEETSAGMHLRWALDALTECTKEITRALSACDARTPVKKP